MRRSQDLPFAPQAKPKRRCEAIRPIAISIKETCRVSGLGRTKVYELIGEGRLRTAKIGVKRLVVFDSIEELVESSKA